jgi:hypothetical protein
MTEKRLVQSRLPSALKPPSRNTDLDADGIVQTETALFMKCPACSKCFDSAISPKPCTSVMPA